MKMIKKIVDSIDDELCGAEKYAEEYIYQKSVGNSTWASKYKTMSTQELEHGMTQHDRVVEEIERVRSVYQPSQEMLDKWEKSHKEYLDKVARIKIMLSM